MKVAAPHLSNAQKAQVRRVQIRYGISQAVALAMIPHVFGAKNGKAI